MACCWRPNTFTIACPVCISSMCPLRLPVDAHWATNCFCERPAMRTVTRSTAGTASSEITRARSGLIVSIMTRTPMTVRRDGDELGQALLERLADVVDVVGDAAQDVAARLAVEVA